MISIWDKFIVAIGKDERSPEFLELEKSIGEAPHVSSDPDAYNDPVGGTRYYKYTRSGVEVGFRGGVLNHIHFYIEASDGYSALNEGFCDWLNASSTYQSVLDILGQPAMTGGGRKDLLIGYVGKWLRYQRWGVVVNFQFNESDALCRVTVLQA
ncbi:hypothetical protein [Pseudomonas citronellolis]|uniref:hypothetical protein n=1 Tax=Pseudomonas citronellolis TaxID=53408 RepID=UPI0023E35672|nr:hypothetical protein [Pseudomonas citronellolis]MDF3934346.1 hypothetical protein [Pseudomonas citronellolis]